jgi:alpha-L-rhamnosidase
MRKWLDFMGTFVKDGITDRDTYGDWCVPPEDPKLIHSNDPARKTAGTLLATAYLYHDLGLAAGYAELLGKPDEAAELGRRRQHILAAFDKKFFNERSATYANGSQTSSVLPLAFEMVPREHQQAVFDRLVENIMVKTKGHIGTGLVGGQWLMQTLTRHGRPDVALRLVTNDDYPSWGYMIRRGATTIWELWNGDTADPAMNSHNHVMLVGDLTAWLYEDLAGIRSDPAAPGFRRLIMRPQPVAGLDWCRAAYPSACGSVESAWRIADGQFRWSIVLPANTSATIFVPASDPALVREGSGPAGEAKGVEFLRAEARRAVYRIGSGRYEFSAPCRNRDVASIDTLR